jgi:hypothetical protein
MNAPLPWYRPLQVLALALGVAIIVLLFAWLRSEPVTPPPDNPDMQQRAVDLEPAPAVEQGGVHDPIAADELPQPVIPREASVANDGKATLFGTVRSADGTLVSGGYFWLHSGSSLLGTASLRAATFAFPGLTPGRYRLTSRIPDELPIDREVEVRAPHTRLDIELPGRWLLTVNAVTSDGTPLVEAMADGLNPVQLGRNFRALGFRTERQGDLPPTDHAEFTAGLGPFRANDPSRGRRQLRLPKQTVGILTLPRDRPVQVALVVGTAVVAQQAATPDQTELTFVLGADALASKMGTLRFRCIDASGAPVVGAKISIRSLDGMQFGGRGASKMETDEDGRYTAKNLVPGVVSFSARHETLRVPPIEFVVQGGANLDAGNVTLRAGVELEFGLDNFGGSGSVRVFWLGSAAGARSGGTYIIPRNGASQKVSWFPGRYSLTARGKGGVARLEFDTAAPPAQPIRFDLRPGASLRIVPTVTGEFATFEVATVSGATVYRGETRGGTGNTTELPAGDYTLTVTDLTGATTRRQFTLPQSGTSIAIP